MHAWVEQKLKALGAQKLRRQLDLPRGIDLTSNDTLSLKDAPQLLQAAHEAVEGAEFGAGGREADLARGPRGRRETTTINKMATAAASNWV